MSEAPLHTGALTSGVGAGDVCVARRGAAWSEPGHGQQQGGTQRVFQVRFDLNHHINLTLEARATKSSFHGGELHGVSQATASSKVVRSESSRCFFFLITLKPRVE
jgi:hypothetical protein